MMGNAAEELVHAVPVAIPPPKPIATSLKSALKETFFPDDPFRQLNNHHHSLSTKLSLLFQYFIPILQWAPRYTLHFFKSDLIAGITIASLAVPQGISHATLANLPPIMGLYSSFVPPLVYAVMGSSRDLAVGTAAVASLLIASVLGKEVNPNDNPELYVQLAITATFFSGVFQAALGFLRLGFIVDLLSHATIVGFMGGAATIVSLQQLKGILGLVHFTQDTDLVSVMHSVFSQTHHWRWESGVFGCFFLSFLILTKYYSKKKTSFFWINAVAPLSSVVFGSILVYVTNANEHGLQVILSHNTNEMDLDGRSAPTSSLGRICVLIDEIGHLKKGLNPLSVSELAFDSPYLPVAIKTGVITGIVALAEGIAVGRSFAVFNNYHIDGNKEMVALGMMNIAGSCTSCFLTAGPFSRTAVNFNAGCKSPVSNIVMAMAVMITLLFLMPFFHYTPLAVLSSIIIAAMLGLIDYRAALHLWKVDKFDFVVCISAYAGVVFGSVEIGLAIPIVLSLMRVLLFVARPRTSVLGNIPNSVVYRSISQYPVAHCVPGTLILQIDAPICFANASYLRERISRWIYEEEEKLKSSGECSLRYVVLDMTTVGSIDTSGISMFEELKKNTDRRGFKLVLANPRSEVIKKLDNSKFIDKIGREWIYLTVGEAVDACTACLLQVHYNGC